MSQFLMSEVPLNSLLKRIWQTVRGVRLGLVRVVVLIGNHAPWPFDHLRVWTLFASDRLQHNDGVRQMLVLASSCLGIQPRVKSFRSSYTGLYPQKLGPMGVVVLVGHHVPWPFDHLPEHTNQVTPPGSARQAS